MEQVTKNIFVETKKRGCNPGFVVTSEGIVMIDAPVEPAFGREWKEEIGKRGKVRFLINTEHHMDHWVCNSLFEVETISHEATRKTMAGMDLDFIRNRMKILYVDPLDIPEGYALKLPNLTYTERMTLYVGQHTFHLMHTPGHTGGQTAVYIPEEKVVFTGDNVVGQTRTAYHDALPEKWIESLKIVEKLDAGIIVPGHGKLVEKAYLKTQADIIQKMSEAEKKAKAEGRTLDDAAKEKIDPFFKTRDTGIKSSVTLTSTPGR
jgi:cyclase